MSHNRTLMPQRALKLSNMLGATDNSFGVLRLAMALAVLVSHCFYLKYGTMSAEPLIQWTGYTLGQHGVQVFFILSGILVTQSVMNSRNLLDFAVARAVRILPALVVCVLVVAFVLGPSVSGLSIAAYFSDPALSAYVLKTITLTTGSATLPGVFEDSALRGIVNSSLWTLKYEVVCYGLLAGTAWIAIQTDRHRLVCLVGLALSGLLFWRYQPRMTETNSFAANISYFWLFFGTGVLAYLNRARLVVTWKLMIPLAVITRLAINTPLAEVALATALGFAALWLASLRMGPLRDLANRHDYSYGVYIYGVPVTQTLLQCQPGLEPLALIVATASITIALAATSWNFIEKPALQWRQ